MEKSLVIGGLGFIGSHLVEDCVSRGQEVTVLTRSTQKLENLGKVANRVNLIVKDLKEMGEEIRGFDYIFNLSGTTDNYSLVEGNPFLDVEQNCMNTLCLLESMRKYNPRAILIFASTFFVNGNPEKIPVTPTQRCEPLGLYGATRLAGENFCRIYNHVFDLDSRVMRFCNVFGPREVGSKRKAAFNFLIKEAVEGRVLPVYSGGDFFRDYIYVTDVASACNIVAQKGQKNQVYYVGRGEKVKFKELVNIILGETGASSISIEPPDFHKRVGIGDFVCDPSPLKALGWEPIVNLEEGIKRTIDYYRGKNGK
jgi:UDP-glucose 4-epimerase